MYICIINQYNMWYYLDPDNNKKDPECGLFCARCKRKLKENLFQTYHSIVLHPDKDTPWFRMAKPLEGNSLIGDDCFKKVTSEYGIMDYK
jgi:hypothetical protein